MSINFKNEKIPNKNKIDRLANTIACCVFCKCMLYYEKTKSASRLPAAGKERMDTMEQKRFVSWNVNGIRACVNKDFYRSFFSLFADAFCLQETKLQAGQIELDLPGYTQYWNYAEKKGYSGTAVFVKEEPLAVTYGMDAFLPDNEGRLITLEYDNYFLVNQYVPNSQDGLRRLDYRMQWEDALCAYLSELQSKKPVILCGDLNVAHKEIDLKNPKSNRRNPGFTDEERGKFTQLLDAGFTDTFRYFYPEKEDAYSWWSYRFSAREKNVGWRIDYFVASQSLDAQLQAAEIHSDIYGSDHCPVSLDILL